MEEEISILNNASPQIDQINNDIDDLIDDLFALIKPYNDQFIKKQQKKTLKKKLENYEKTAKKVKEIDVNYYFHINNKKNEIKNKLNNLNYA